METIYHRNTVPGGPAVKGVECRRCGTYVGLVQAKSGSWYTCELRPSMGENSQALVAYPFQPHGKVCGQAQREEDARRAEREAELRSCIEQSRANLEQLDPEHPMAALLAESIQVWETCLQTEGFTGEAA